jgi:hypothetical protein
MLVYVYLPVVLCLPRRSGCMHLVCTMRAVCGPCAPALACHLHDIHHTSCLAAQWCSLAEQVSSPGSYYGSISRSVVWFRPCVFCTFGPFRDVGGQQVSRLLHPVWCVMDWASCLRPGPYRPSGAAGCPSESLLAVVHSAVSAALPALVLFSSASAHCATTGCCPPASLSMRGWHVATGGLLLAWCWVLLRVAFGRSVSHVTWHIAWYIAVCCSTGHCASGMPAYRCLAAWVRLLLM